MNLLERIEDIELNVVKKTNKNLVRNVINDVKGKAREPLMDLTFTVNETDKVVVGRDRLTGETLLSRCTKGDKFDAYTGVCLILFENLTGYTYSKLNTTIEKFAPRTKDSDPTMNFIKVYIKQALGLSKEDVDELVKDAEVVELKKKDKVKKLHKFDIVVD